MHLNNECKQLQPENERMKEMNENDHNLKIYFATSMHLNNECKQCTT